MPLRTQVISARMAIAISEGILLPICKPTGPRMRADAALHLAAQQRLADHIYSHWLQGAWPGFHMAQP